jgi:hypothetical protein
MMSWVAPKFAPAPATPPDELPLPATAASAQALEAFFLNRLRRLAALEGQTVLDPQQHRLLNLARFSTYRDCEALGLRAPARSILGLGSE